MALVIRTACLKSSAARRDDALDVTRGTGTGEALAFAPSIELLAWVKAEGRRGRLENAWLEYRRRYLEEMDGSQTLRSESWIALAARGSITLCCYCQNPLRCHRILLTAILVERYGAIYEGEVCDE